MTLRAQREAILQREREAIRRGPLTPADVWLLLSEGCNTAEIASYAQVSLTVARVMCAQALRAAAA